MSDADVFRQYVTSTAFSLSLSGNMVVALDHIANCRYSYGTHLKEFSRPVWSAKDGLKRRGLIVWDDGSEGNRGPKLTEAGRLVYELCQLAGLIDRRQDAVA